MEQRKRSGKYDGKANLLLVNMQGAADAKKFCSEKGISACTSLVGRPSSEYGLKYIPHKVLIDKNGVVVENFKVDWCTVDKLAGI